MNNVPKHYRAKIDVIEFCEQHFNQEEIMGFYKFNIIKYATRLGRKDNEIREYEKILEYSKRAIKYLEKKAVTDND